MAIQKFKSGDCITFKPRKNRSGNFEYLGYILESEATSIFGHLIANHLGYNLKYTNTINIYPGDIYEVELTLSYTGVTYYLIRKPSLLSEYFLFKNTYEEMYDPNNRYASLIVTEFTGTENITFDPKNLTKYGQPLGYEDYHSIVVGVCANSILLLHNKYPTLKNYGYCSDPKNIDSVSIYELIHKFDNDLYLIKDRNRSEFFVFNNFDDELHLSRRSSEDELPGVTMSTESYPLGGKVRYGAWDGIIVSFDLDTRLYTVYFEDKDKSYLCPYNTLIYSGETDWRFEYSNRK